MNSLFTVDSLNQIIITISAILIAEKLSKVLSASQWASGLTYGWIAMAIKNFLTPLLHSVRYLALLLFLSMQIKQLVDQAGPPSRMDTLLIAFWTWWALFVVSDMMGKYGKWLERRRSERA